MRTSIRKEIAGLMAQIDLLVETISTGRDLGGSDASWEQLLRTDNPVLEGADSSELSAFLRSEREGWSLRDLPAGGSKS